MNQHEERRFPKVKMAVVVVLLLLIVIVAMQNMETVEPRVLWLTLPMPRGVLMLVMALFGFVLGLLASFILRKKRLM